MGVSQYQQLASVLRHQITHGELQEGQQLPTVADLATQYQLARITVRQAYAVLSAEGLVNSRRGRGTFVSKGQTGMDARLRSAINDPRSDHLRMEILEQRRNTSLPADLAAGACTYPDYTFIRKLHRHDGAPFCLVEIHVATEIQALFPAGAEADRKIAWLLNDYAADRMHKVQQSLTVAPADLVLARQLDCAYSTPIAHMTRRMFDAQGRIALAGRFWYRGDRFVMDTEIPFDVWVNYPGVVMPDSLAPTEDPPATDAAP